MGVGWFTKKLSPWQKELTIQRTIPQITGSSISVHTCFNHTLKFISAVVLRTTFFKKINHKTFKLCEALGLQNQDFVVVVFVFFLPKSCVKFPRNTICVLVCLKARVVPGNSSFCSAYLALGGFMDRLQSVLKCRLQWKLWEAEKCYMHNS